MPTPQRLPIVNNDDGVWGDIIRQYIAKEHYNDDTDNPINGSHKTITIRPGTTAAGTAPLTFNSGPLMTTPEAGAVEFNTDSLYLTTTTGTVRKKVAIYDDSSGAAGDIYYRDSGGSFVRLPAGADGKTLSISSGLPAWGDVDLSSKVSKSGDTMTGTLTINASPSTTVGSGTSQLTITPSSSLSGASLLYFNTDRPWGFRQDGTGAGTALALINYSTDKYFDVYQSGSSTRALSIYTSGTAANNSVGLYSQPTAGSGALQVGSGATGGVVFFNTSDQSSNKEAVALKWASNEFLITHEVSGTGTLRSVSLATWATVGSGTPGRKFTVSPSTPFFNYNWGATGLTGNMISTASSTLSGSSGTQTVLALSPTLNQSSTAAFKMLEINPSVTAIGSGTNYLIDAQYGSSVRFQVFSSATATNNTLVSAPNGSGDVALAIQNNATTANETASLLFYTTTNLTTAFARIRTTRVDGANSRLAMGPSTASTITNHITMYGDTGLMSIGAGSVPANGLVTIGTNSTTAAAGVYFGTDVTLYRSASGTLKTDGAFEAGSAIRAVNRYYLTNSGSNFPGMERYAATDSGFSYDYFYRSRATGGQVLTNDVLGAFGFRGHDGSSYINGDGARIQAAAAENFTSSAYSAHIDIVNNNVGTTSSVTTWRFAAGGVLQSRVTGSSGGLSFGSGSTQDVNLYRTAADQLRTDDAFIVSSTSGGQVSSYSGPSVFTPKFQINANSAEASELMFRYTNDVNPPRMAFLKSRGTTSTSFTATTTSDILGELHFAGTNGTTAAEAATIRAYATASGSGTTYQPGGIAFSTSNAAGSATAINMYIDDSGYVGLGAYGPATKPGARLTFTAATTAAGGILFGTDTTLYRSAADTLTTDDAFTAASISTGGNITVTGTVDGRDVATDGAKLDTIAANADVTNTASVTSAGALMDSELTDLAGVKALDTSTLATLAGTQTLTNKRVTVRSGTTTSSATPTINTDNVDAYHLTAQAVDITSFTTNLSGTPTDFQKLIISITGTAARAITWGASFENGVVTLPTTTTSTERLDVGFIWNAVTSKWRCMASGSA